jgi:hypothetical protein
MGWEQVIALATINLALIGLLATFMYSLIGRLDSDIKRVEGRIDALDKKLEKIEERLTRLENDMIEVKTILRMKECCMIKDDRQMKKVE